MASYSLIASTPANEVLNSKQWDGESLKDAWYRICNAQNRSSRMQSTNVLLRNFYMGTTWYRFVLYTITGDNFLSSHPLGAFNAVGNLVGSPPIIINETMLILEHIMRRLDVTGTKCQILNTLKFWIKRCITK